MRDRQPWPCGIHLGVGAVALVIVVFGAAEFTDPGSLVRLLAMAVAAGTGAALIPDWRYSGGLALIAYLLYVGFLVNRFGELSWAGRDVSWELLVFAFAYLLGLGQRWMGLLGR